MIINRAADLDDVRGWIESDVCARLNTAEERNVCLLVCEELLVHLLNAGYTHIRVESRGLRQPRVQIIAGGEPDDAFALESEDGDVALEEAINRNLLRHYDRYVEYRYKKGSNRYTVWPSQDPTGRLTDDILAFYDRPDGEKSDRSPGLLWEIAKKHPAQAAAGVVIRMLRHLAALLLPVFASNIIQELSIGHTSFTATVRMNLAASCLALTLNLFFAWLDNRIYHRFTRSVETALKAAITQKLQALSFRFHSEMPTGKLLSKLVSDVQFVKLLLYDYSIVLLFMPMDILFILVLSVMRMPAMVLVFGLLLPVYAILLRAFSVPVMKTKAQVRQETEKVNSQFKEMLAMDQITRSHGLQERERRKITRSLRQVQQAATAQDRVQLRLNNISYGIAQGFRIVILALAVVMMAGNRTDVGSVVLFLSLLDMMIATIQRAMDSAPQITQGLDSLQSIHELLREKSMEKTGSRRLPRPIRGEIRLEDLVFRYEPDKPAVLDGVDISIPAGKCVALVGPSGSGKTTVLNLVLGLYARESGRLLIDGVDIDELDKNHFRRSVAVVPQTPVLFSGTLWENLTYGLEYISTAQVMEALRRTGLQQMVSEGGEGLAMPILEDGHNLSGGQRQRVAIARALLRQPRIMLLDEATSALDPQSELEVQRTIESIMHACTVVIVAHRLNTVQKADMIYEIRDGRALRYDSYEDYEKRQGVKADGSEEGGRGV